MTPRNTLEKLINKKWILQAYFKIFVSLTNKEVVSFSRHVVIWKKEKERKNETASSRSNMAQ